MLTACVGVHPHPIAAGSIGLSNAHKIGNNCSLLMAIARNWETVDSGKRWRTQVQVLHSIDDDGLIRGTTLVRLLDVKNRDPVVARLAAGVGLRALHQC